jgi:hypothetical protein
VSSYGRNIITRSAPCLGLVQCPLYTLAAATYCGAPHLRRRSSPRSCPGRVVPFGTSRSGRLHSRAELHPTRGASGSSIPSAPKVNHPRFRYRRPAPFGWTVHAQEDLHNSSSISVSIRSPLQIFPHLAEAAREPKPTARPDVVEASEGHFPQQGHKWLTGNRHRPSDLVWSSEDTLCGGRGDPLPWWRSSLVEATSR